MISHKYLLAAVELMSLCKLYLFSTSVSGLNNALHVSLARLIQILSLWGVKLATGRPCILALVDSGTVPAFTCNCLQVASVFMRRRYFDLCVFADNACVRK